MPGSMPPRRISHAKRLLKLAQAIAFERPDFHETRGPGAGNRYTNEFMEELRKRARKTFGVDYAEQKICGPNALCVDYYFPHESTIVEVALGLPKPKTEFEKDVLKAIMAQESGHQVKRLLFISRPGAKQKCAQPGRAGIVEWTNRMHGIVIEIHELGVPLSL